MTSSSDEFFIRLSSDPQGVILWFDGVLDETASFVSAEVGQSKNIVLDLENLRLINSAGVRTWMQWIRSLEAVRRRVITFRACSKPVVDQMNMISGFVPPGARIESFDVPYYCELCDSSKTVLFRSGQEFMAATADKPLELRCPAMVSCQACSEPMEINVISSKYFDFLKYRP